MMMMITDIDAIKMMCISYRSLLNKSFHRVPARTHSHCRAMFYKTSATVPPWMVPICTHLPQFKTNIYIGYIEKPFSLHSETHFSVRRADTEKPGCFIFKWLKLQKYLTKNLTPDQNLTPPSPNIIVHIMLTST